MGESRNHAEDMDWPPNKLEMPDTVDVLMLNYMPEGDRPDGVTPDEQCLQTQPYPAEKPYTYPDLHETQAACGTCRFYVEGGACALVKGVIEPVKGICKFYEGGTPLAYNTQVFPLYEKVEAEYRTQPSEPYLRESVAKNIIDREHELIASGVPENEVHDILQKEFNDTSISVLINETSSKWKEEDHPRDEDGKFSSGKGKIRIIRDNIKQKFKADEIEKIINSLPDDLKTKDIRVIDANINERSAGNFQHGIVDIYPNKIPVEHLGTVVTHELAHGKFNALSSDEKMSFGADALSLPKLSTYSDGFSRKIYELGAQVKLARQNQKALPDNATEQEKRSARIKLEDAQIQQDLALSDFADEYYAEYVSIENGYNPVTGLKVSSEDMDKIRAKIPKTLQESTIKELQFNDTNYIATGAKKDSEPSMHNLEGHMSTDPKVMGYQNENPDPDALVFDISPLYGKKEQKLIRETIGELSHQFNWMTSDYLQRVSSLTNRVGGRFVLVRASAEAITDHRSEGEPYRRLLKGEELAQLTRTGYKKTTDINHLQQVDEYGNVIGLDWRVDSDVIDAEYDPVRKESQMLVHLRDPTIIHYIETGQIDSVSINAGAPRRMNTECNTNECFVVPTGLMLGELDGIAFTWVVNDPNGIVWKGRHIPPATPGVKTTRIELI